ncbi:MAG: hypothetical protein IPH76_15475 [Xanthomonadales bacterium]|nr:hypothetical protein [Xanthomonadales bacterium]
MADFAAATACCRSASASAARRSRCGSAAALRFRRERPEAVVDRHALAELARLLRIQLGRARQVGVDDLLLAAPALHACAQVLEVSGGQCMAIARTGQRVPQHIEVHFVERLGATPVQIDRVVAPGRGVLHGARMHRGLLEQLAQIGGAVVEAPAGFGMLRLQFGDQGFDPRHRLRARHDFTQGRRCLRA